jgi:hypothetical protein
MSKKTVFKEDDNMKKNVIGLVVILVLSFSLGKYFFKSDVKVEYLSENSNPEYQSDLKIVGDKVYFKDFKSAIGKGKFINENTYVFLGLDVKDNLSKFILNFDNYTVSKEKINGKISPDSEVVFVKEDEFLVIGEGIVRYTADKVDVIAKDISFKGEKLYKLSDNDIKIMYYNSEKGSIYTYHIPKKLHKRISYDISDETLERFYEDFNLSDDGGYIFISENGEEKSISIIGSDSSKIYGDHIIAENPIWIKNTEKAAYLYPYSPSGNNHNYKIGVFNIPKRKIDYINYSDEEIVYPYIWSSMDGDIIYFVGEKNANKFKVSSLIKYDMSDKVKTRYDRGYTFDILKDSVYIDKIDGNMAIFYSNGTEGYNCDFINTNMGSEMKVEKIETIASDKLLATSKGFIVNADNAISYYNGESTKVVYRVTGTLDDISIQGDNLSIIEEISEGIQIVFLKIN